MSYGWAGRGLSVMAGNYFLINGYISDNYIYVLMRIFTSERVYLFGRYGNWFMWVIRVLQTVEPQIRAIGPRKWSRS